MKTKDKDESLKEKKSKRVKPSTEYFTERTYLRVGKSHTGTIYLCIQSTENTLKDCVTEIKAVLPVIEEQLYNDFDNKFGDKLQ